MKTPAIIGCLSITLLLGACGDDGTTGPSKAADPPSFGKTDAPFGIVERGRFDDPAGGAASGTLDGTRADAWRFNGWGNTRVRVTLTSPGVEMDPYVIIDGPFPGGDGKIVAFNDDDPNADRLDSVIEVTLAEPGAYRILAGTYGTFNAEPNAGGNYELTFECLDACAMPQITLAQLLSGLSAELGEANALDAVRGALGNLFPDAEQATVDGVLAQVQAVMANPDNAERFPVVPLSLTETAQGFFESDETPVATPGPVNFEVEAILTQGCVAKRSGLKPVHPLVPGLTTGSVTNYAIDECTLQRAQDFAEVLNNLALDNGSTVSYAGTTYTSISEVTKALIAAGHRITITNDRYFADFLGLYYNGAAVAAPLWLETTIPTADGTGFLALPSPHTHHTVVVEGPLVNTKLMYYMGVSAGTSFRAVSNIRSPWTGERSRYTYSSDTQPDLVETLLVTAGELRRKWTAEAAGLPAGGYGALGVCNDSTGVLEMSVEGSASIFPFAHPVIADSPDNDAIDDLLARLPADIVGYDSAEAFTRILSTLPFASVDDLPFPQFKAEVQALMSASAR